MLARTDRYTDDQHEIIINTDTIKWRDIKMAGTPKPYKILILEEGIHALKGLEKLGNRPWKNANSVHSGLESPHLVLLTGGLTRQVGLYVKMLPLNLWDLHPTRDKILSK